MKRRVASPGPLGRLLRAGAILACLALLGLPTTLRPAEPEPSHEPLGLGHVPEVPAPSAGSVIGLSLSDPALPRVAEEPAASAPETPEDLNLSDQTSRLVRTSAAPTRTEEAARRQYLQTQMNLARQKRKERDFELARRTLMALLEGIAPEDLKRAALLELGLVAQDAGEMQQARRVFEQYVAMYPKHESLPEVLLRQGLLYRRMGATGLAVGKFSAVLMALLNLPMDRLEDAQRLSLLAKAETAETHYQTGAFDAAADQYGRLLKEDSAHLNRQLVSYKLIRCLTALNRNTEAAVQAERYVAQYPDSEELAEVRFILASAYRQAGRAAEAQRQVLVLLESQRERARKNPTAWAYWQKRAGNEIANQFYQDGEYQVALTIYTHLAELDPTPAWRIPVLYQIGLVHERLEHNPLALETYEKVLESQKELTPGGLTPSLTAAIDMARWRKSALERMERLQADVNSLGATNLLATGPGSEPSK